MRTSRVLCAQLLVAGLTIAACTDSSPRIVVDPDLAAMEADYIIFGLTHYGSRRGIRESIVEADTALVLQESSVLLLRGNVVLTAYDQEFGTEKAVVTSDRGRLDMMTNELFAEGNAVLLIRADGRRIESDELRYMPDENRIRSDSHTLMYNGDEVIEGAGFSSDLNFERVTIRNARTRGGAVRP